MYQRVSYYIIRAIKVNKTLVFLAHYVIILNTSLMSGGIKMLQPDDIRTTKFKKGLLGYKAADVDSFKETVFRAYSDLLKDYQDTKDKFEKLTAAMEETRLKLFELENKVQKAESVSGADDSVEAKRKADQIIKNAEATAAEIIAKAKAQGEKLENSAKAEVPKPTEEPAKESASSKFFKKEEDVHTAATNDDDDDEIFVGEIEDARKPDRMMIGDGEEEDAGFEFL